MKLRRAMAIAAATAVIAPATFLAAPAAYATTSTPPVSTETGPDTPGTEDPADDTTGTQTPDTTTPDTTGEQTPEGTTPDENAPDAGTAGETKTEDKPEAGTAGEGTLEEKTPDKGTPDGKTPEDEEISEDEDSEEFPACAEASIDVSLGGFPNKIVAGSGWKNFTFDVKNTGDTDIETLEVFTIATYGKSAEDFDERLVEKYAQFEYKDAETGKWVNDLDGSGINNGLFFGAFPIDAGEQVTIDLRVRIDKAAPAGAGVTVAVGGYDNGAEDETFECFEDGAVYPFTIVKSGGNAGDVDDSEPTGEKPDRDVKPQGEAKPIPVTGNLAETGSDSSLPVIGAIGGIAVLAGAGVVFAMKRRRGDATA
ncbi:LAETG motif-containing sortase-dependent surface protein [Streptomyces sp. NPDC054802]